MDIAFQLQSKIDSTDFYQRSCTARYLVFTDWLQLTFKPQQSKLIRYYQNFHENLASGLKSKNNFNKLSIKGLLHELDLAFVDMHGQFCLNRDKANFEIFWPIQ